MAERIYRGDTWEMTWFIMTDTDLPVDLTDASVRLHVRDESGTLLTSLAIGSGITVTPLDGRIDSVVASAVTALFPLRCKYDVEVTYPTGVRKTYDQSTLEVLEDVTHD